MPSFVIGIPSPDFSSLCLSPESRFHSYSRGVESDTPSRLLAVNLIFLKPSFFPIAILQIESPCLRSTKLMRTYSLHPSTFAVLQLANL